MLTNNNIRKFLNHVREPTHIWQHYGYSMRQTNANIKPRTLELVQAQMCNPGHKMTRRWRKCALLTYMGRQNGDMRVRVVPSYHPRNPLDGGRHFVRTGVKSNPQKIEYHSTQHPRKRNKQNLRKEKRVRRKGYLGLRGCGGEKLGVDLDAVLLPLAPHLRRRPPYQGGGALAGKLQVGK